MPAPFGLMYFAPLDLSPAHLPGAYPGHSGPGWGPGMSRARPGAWPRDGG